MRHQYKVRTPEFAYAKTPGEAATAAEEVIRRKYEGRESESRKREGRELDVVVKAQVLTGGRGLGHFKETGYRGGVQMCKSSEEVREAAAQMIGKTLVTKQTGPQGKPCNGVMVAERLEIEKEFYFALLLDPRSGAPCMIGSSAGGTSVEDIAAKHPESIIKQTLPRNRSVPSRDCLQSFCVKMRLGEEAMPLISGLIRMFFEKDCLLLEINPLAKVPDGRLLVCDAKVNFDDNAAFRHPDLFTLRDESQEDPREVAASHSNLNYVALDGTVGCMVNGAGLAMATLDLLLLHGGRPANFLDVGGGASKQQIVDALRILENDQAVQSIFINIFGGIMRCDIIAEGLVEASRQISISKPIVVRLEGTRKAEAEALLSNSDLRMTFESDFSEAARKAVKIAEINQIAREAHLSIAFC